MLPQPSGSAPEHESTGRHGQGRDATTAWLARLDLEFDRDAVRTRLVRAQHEGPLRIQRPFHPEGVGSCHIYVLHPPGGMAGGDKLEIRARLQPGSHALLTAPAAQKLYRCPGPRSEQFVGLSARAAHLEWLPPETIAFSGAASRLGLDVELFDDARFIGWDICCLGRRASDAPFETGSVDLEFRVRRDGRPVFIDRLRLDPSREVVGAAWGLRALPCVGTLVCSPAPRDAVMALRDQIHPRDDEVFATTQIRDAIICRYLGHQGLRARELFAQAWALLRPSVLGRPPCPPRIWAT